MELRYLTMILLAFIFFTAKIGEIKLRNDEIWFTSEEKALYFFIAIINSIFSPFITKLLFNVPYENLFFNSSLMLGMFASIGLGLIIQMFFTFFLFSWLSKKEKMGEKRIGEKQGGKFISLQFRFAIIFLIFIMAISISNLF